MAEIKNYGLIGVGQNVQLGKNGPKLKGNADNSTFEVTQEDGATLARISGANGTSSSDFVTKAQLDASDASTDGFNVTLGDVDASGDGDWHITPSQGDYEANGSITRQGAVTSLTNASKVSDALDKLNETMLNVHNNTFVRDVDFTVDTATGGAPLSSTLTVLANGNPTHYTISWGDGTTTDDTTDSTPSHTYSNNSNSPFTVGVTAYNEDGAGEGSTVTYSKTSFITLYTANPAAGYDFYTASSGGSTTTTVDDGTALYFDNETTNIGSAAATYVIEWGDGQANADITADTNAGGTQGSRLAHTFATSTEEDQLRTVKLTLLTHTTADPSVIPNNTTKIIKVYDTHTPTVALSATTGINEEGTSGLPITFTNNTESTIGSYADFGIQYRYVWGDGTTTTVNTGTSSSGDTGQTIAHTYELSGGQQSGGTAVDFAGNLEVISSHSSSPFKTANFTVHVEPDLRATVTGTAVSSNLNNASGDNARTLYKGTDLSGTNRAIVTVDNTTQNANAYIYNWNDGGSNDTPTEAGSPAGSVSGANITHDYFSQSVASYTLNFSGSGRPELTDQTDTDTVAFNLKAVPAAPTGVSGKSITLSTAGQYSPSGGTGLCANAADFTSGSLAAGSSLESTTARRYETTTTASTSTISDAYRSDSGTASALWDGSADGAKAFSVSTGETGTFTSLVITNEGDARNEIGSSYPQNFYQVFSGRMTKNFTSEQHGIHSMAIKHDSTGTTNNVYVVYDQLTSAPSVTTGTLAELTAGTKRYVSGIPYYNSGSPAVKLVGGTITNLTGQAYKDSTSIVNIQSGTNAESTSGSAITTGSKSYTDIDGGTTMLSSGVPKANVGVGGAYTMGDISVNITGSSRNTIESIKIQGTNHNGTGSASSDTAEKIQVWKVTPTLDEEAIDVSDSLGAGFDDDGVRISGHGSASDTPAFSDSTNYYTGSAWTGAVTVAGTSEAINRLNTIKHFTTNLSSGYLPAGPDLNTGRSGAQYFTFAFRRTTMANFTVRMTGTVSGFFIAAPATDIDDASTLNGWIDAGITYGGAGTPGADTGNGGNGSNGCAFTSGDRIQDGTGYSNDTFELTLGDQNATNSFGNQILVRIKLESGDSITALSIE